MSRFYLLPLICAIFMLPVLTSCEQEPEVQIKFEEKTGADYLNSYFTSPIMFHYAFADEANNTYSGWIVDNKGKVRTYKLDYQPFQVTAFEIHNNDFQKVIENSEVIDIELDLEVLVQQYKKTVFVAKEELETLSENSDAETTSGFFAYTLSYGRDQESCGARSHSYVFQQVILQYDGETTLKNKSHMTNDMIEWMKDIQNNQGL